MFKQFALGIVGLILSSVAYGQGPGQGQGRGQEDYCFDYANSAGQLEDVIASQGAVMGLPQRRDPFEDCRSMSLPVLADQYTARLQTVVNFVNAQRMPGVGSQAEKCEYYAVGSNRLERLAAAFGNCPMTSYPAEAHYNWCLATDPGTVFDELQTRRSTVTQCLVSINYYWDEIYGEQAAALTAPETAGTGWNDFPDGRWQETCRRPRWEGRTIVAQCRADNGVWQLTRFDTNFAFTALTNCNGQLRGSTSCTVTGNAPPRPGPVSGGNGGTAITRPASFPEGIWRMSCSSPDWDGNFMTAMCRTNAGGMVRSRIDLSSYRGRVTNCDGELVARSGCGSAPGLPPGPWANFCRNPQMSTSGRRTLTADCVSGGHPSSGMGNRPTSRISIEIDRYFGPLTVCNGQFRRGDQC